MTLTCEIIRDLLPLYHDHACSDESREAVAEHLKTCAGCQKALADLSAELVQATTLTDLEQASVRSLQALQKKLLQKNVLVAGCSVIAVVVALLGAWAFIAYRETPIAYHEGLVTATRREADPEQEVNMIVDLWFNEDDYYCAYGMSRSVVQAGVKKDIACVYYTETIWTKHVSKAKAPLYFSLGNSIMVYDENSGVTEPREDVSAVYYLIGDYDKLRAMPDDEFAEVFRGAALLWDK
jgi:hypothetical protein